MHYLSHGLSNLSIRTFRISAHYAKDSVTFAAGVLFGNYSTGLRIPVQCRRRRVSAVRFEKSSDLMGFNGIHFAGYQKHNSRGLERSEQKETEATVRLVLVLRAARLGSCTARQEKALARPALRG